MTQSNQARGPLMQVIGEGAGLGEDILAALRSGVRRREPVSAEMRPSQAHVLGEGTDLGTDIIRSVRNAFRPVVRRRM